MREAKERKIYRILPCYRNDILAIEAWLEDMAAEGYMLKKFKWGGAEFEKCEPVKVRYRLLLAPEGGLMDVIDHLAKDTPTVRDNYIALQGEAGWAHITSYNYLQVFLCRKAEIPEPERDILATMDKLVSDDRKTNLFSFFAILAALGNLWLQTGLGMLLCITIGTWKYAGMVLSGLYFMWNDIVQHVRLLKLRRTMKDNTYEKVQDDYTRDTIQAKNRRHQVVWAVFMVLLVTSTVSAVVGLYAEKGEEPLRSYYAELPFPMLESVVQDGVMQIVDWGDSTIRQWDDILVPVAVEVTQYSDYIDIRTGERIDRKYLAVSYFETRSDWMAEQLAKDYLRFDMQLRLGKRGKNAVKEFSDLNVDYAAGYETWRDTIILAEGNKMLRISYYGYDDMEDEVAQIYADYLLAEDSATNAK